MLVYRFTYRINAGRMNEAVAILKEAKNYEDMKRIYTSTIGQGERLCVEFEFEDLATYESYWPDIFADPDFQPWLEKWETVRGEYFTEMWELR